MTRRNSGTSCRARRFSPTTEPTEYDLIKEAIRELKDRHPAEEFIRLLESYTPQELATQLRDLDMPVDNEDDLTKSMTTFMGYVVGYVHGRKK